MLSQISTRTAKTRAIPSLHRDRFAAKVPGLCSVLSSGNTTSPYCRAVSRQRGQCTPQAKLTINVLHKVKKMITITPDDDFNKEINCTYKDKLYSVRDNGAVFRHAPINGRLRSNDKQWTFGQLNSKTGYLEIASVRVHRIVAIAFRGEPPTKDHVVDHIDTNKQNNRPENLRWLTKLENILLNPITVKRIESICNCKIEEFVADPQKYRHLLSNAPSDIQWMRTVTSQQAEECRNNLTNWAKSDKALKGKSLGEWIYYRNQVYSEGRIIEIFKQVETKTGISRQALCSNKAMRVDYYEARKYAAKLLRSELELSDYAIGKLLGLSATTVNIYLEVSPDRYSGDSTEMSEKQFKKQLEMTPQNFIQKNWGAQSEFPCCPQKVYNDPIAEYSVQLKDNAILFQNSYYFTTIIQIAVIDKGKSLLVLYDIKKKEGEDKRWGIMKITFENGKYVHEIIPNYNGTLEHYWQIDVENHFKSIIEVSKWTPLYDSQGKEFNGDYMPF